MTHWAEENPRYDARRVAVHDLRRDGRLVLRGATLNQMTAYILQHGGDGDWYTEECGGPGFHGCTVGDLRRQENRERGSREE